MSISSVDTTSTTSTTEDHINLDILRYHISALTIDCLKRNRDNPDDDISHICHEIDERGDGSCYLVDVVIDKIMKTIIDYIMYQDIKTSYTLKRRLYGRTSINEPAPSWCERTRNPSQYEVATSHDGIISSDFILSYCREVYNKKHTGIYTDYMSKTPLCLQIIDV